MLVPVYSYAHLVSERSSAEWNMLKMVKCCRECGKWEQERLQETAGRPRGSEARECGWKRQAVDSASDGSVPHVGTSSTQPLHTLIHIFRLIIPFYSRHTPLSTDYTTPVHDPDAEYPQPPCDLLS